MVASYYFYMSWDPKYILLILATTVVSYGCAILIEKKTDKKWKKAVLAVALLIEFGILFFFKYLNFTSNMITTVLRQLSIPVHPITLKIILPVGISFYIFQTVGYIVDVYRGGAQRDILENTQPLFRSFPS